MTKDEAAKIVYSVMFMIDKKYWSDMVEDALKMAIKALEKEKKMGKWLGHEMGECSVCGHVGWASDIWDGCEHKYCPNCGVRMVEPLGGEEE